MKSKTITSTFIKTIILALILLLAGQATHLPAGAAGGEDDNLLVRGFGGGFGPNNSGTVKLEFEARTYRSVALQPDGKIVLAGNGPNFGWLGRLNADGRPDPGFGVQGQLIDTNIVFNDVAIQPDGKIVAVGEAFNDNFGVARYLPNGGPDTSFNGRGLATLDFDGGRDVARAVAIQPNGKIVLGGEADNCDLIGRCNDDFGLARFNPDGTPDLSFDGDAKHAFDLGSFDEVKTLVLEANGRIVAIGDTFREDGDRIAMARFLPDGRFDNTLDGDGKFISNFINTHDGLLGGNEAVQPDGKIIVAHEKTVGTNLQMHLLRFQADGRVDTGFGNNGEVPLPPGPVAPRDFFDGNLLRLPNGNLLFAGHTAPNRDLVVASFTPAGQPNPAFGNGLGYVILNFGDREAVHDLAVAPGGQILLLHSTFDGENTNHYLTRLQPNGALDRGGWATADLSVGSDQINAVALQQSNGKIIAVGNSTTSSGNQITTGVAVFTPNGRPDTSFAGSGSLTLGGSSRGRATTVDAQGRLLVASQEAKANVPTDFDLILRRFNPDGSPANFPAPSLTPRADLGQTNDSPEAIVVQSDGKIVLAAASGSEVVLLRYQANGQPDPAFGGQGIVRTDFGRSLNAPTALALQADGKLVVAGVTGADPTTFDFGLARFLSNGQPDPTFGGGDGKVNTDFAGGSDVAHGLAIQADGKIVAGGVASINGQRVFAVARYMPDGAPDASFNGSGRAIAQFAGPHAAAAALVVEPDGRIVLAGCTQEAQRDRFALARFLPNGQPDTSLSGDGKAIFGSPNGLNACAHDLARDAANGDYLLAGYVQETSNTTLFALARVKGRGQVNPPPNPGPGPGGFSVFLPVVVK